MKVSWIFILLIVISLLIYMYLKNTKNKKKSKKKVRFNLKPTYFGGVYKKPPNLPVRWGYNNY